MFKTMKTMIMNSLKLKYKAFMFPIIVIVCLFYSITSSNAAIVNITVNDFSFSPSVTSVITGDTVRWTLESSFPHAIACGGNVYGTSIPNGAIPWNFVLNQGNPFFEYIVTVQGEYKYVDEYNSPLMSGTIHAGNTLPVELTEFVATTIKNEVILDWSTGGEFNNDKFEIQRISIGNSNDFSKNDQNFTTIGTLKGKGTSSEVHNYRYHDRNLNSGTYLYRLKQVDYNSNYVYFMLNAEVNVGIPSRFYVGQNYPNPFNPETKINFEIPEDGFVSVVVYDYSGREVSELVQGNMKAGYQSVDFNGMSLPSGAYIYRINFQKDGKMLSSTKMMMLIK